MIETSVAGISFRVRDNKEVGMLRPIGQVELVHDPENKFDNKAVMVLWDGHHIGFLPARSEARKAFFACQESGMDISAEIKDYSYADYDKGKIVDGTFNNNHIGMLASIFLNVKTGVTDKHYMIDGDPYLRTTTVAKSQDDKGFPLPKHLWEWEHKFETYDDYVQFIDECAEDGNRVEEGATLFLRDGIETPDLPKGWKEICSQFSLEYIEDQVLVVDHNSGTAGTLDMRVTAIVDAEKASITIDFKRSANLSWSYLLQTAYYAYKKGDDYLWVILFGSKNKCGYQIVKKGRSDIEKLYNIYCHNAESLRMSREFKEFRG